MDAGFTPTTGLSGSIGTLLRKVYARFTADAIEDDPQARDFVVLDTLADQEADSQRELAERLGINRTIMVRLIDRLEDVGHVVRTRNPANRRSYALSITPSGRKALAVMRGAVSARDARITAGLGRRERQRLDKLLSRLLPEPDQPDIRSTAYLVAHAHFQMRRRGDALLADSGLKIRHFGPLFAVDRIAPCSQQQLAHFLEITEPATAEVVDELVQAGLIAREQDPGDRRRYALELTDLGREQLGVAHKVVEQLNAEVLTAMDADELTELRALLIKLLPDDRRPGPGH